LGDAALLIGAMSHGENHNARGHTEEEHQGCGCGTILLKRSEGGSSWIALPRGWHGRRLGERSHPGWVENSPRIIAKMLFAGCETK
jgi:hypothetical protein